MSLKFHIGMELNGGGVIIDKNDPCGNDWIAAYKGRVHILNNNFYEAKDFPNRFYENFNIQRVRLGKIEYAQ